jgi:molybdate transport system ATP-binding protein
LSNASTNPAHHRLNIDTHLGPLHLQAQLHLAAPWTVIFGPSGSGKSSILRAACGPLPSNKSRPCFSFCHSRSPGSPASVLSPLGWSESAVAVKSVSPDTTTSEWTILDSTPTHHRNLAYAPQGAILFPHLSVRENIAFATDARHQPNSQLIDTAINLFDLAPLANRLPRDLSGGERQRANLARAFAVPSPHLLLLDEPFTGIGRALRDTLLPRMQQHATQHGIPVLSVTHDVEEALLLNAEVIRLDNGHIIAQGPATEVLATERTQILDTLQP